MTEQYSPGPLAALSDALAGLVAQAAPRVVAVHGRDGRASSGFLWQDNLVVTAAETLEREEDIALTLPDGREVAATLAGRDPGTDVALLRAEIGAAPGWATAEARTGALAVALGRVEAGAVATLGMTALVGPEWRSQRGGRIDQKLVFDLTLTAQAEGGPLLDAHGRLLGMAVFGPRRRVLGIPAATIARVAEVLKDRGRVARGYLGLALQPVRHGGVQGLIVLGVDPGSPAGQAGLLLGDVLVRLDGAPLASVREMLARLEPEMVGRAVQLEVVRAGQAFTVSATVAERPSAAR